MSQGRVRAGVFGVIAKAQDAVSGSRGRTAQDRKMGVYGVVAKSPQYDQFEKDHPGSQPEWDRFAQEYMGGE
jgi:hypothetical protein